MSKLATFCVLSGLTGVFGAALTPHAQAAEITKVPTGQGNGTQDNAIAGETAVDAPARETALQKAPVLKPASPAGPVTDTDLYSQMRIQAGQNVAKNMHQILVGDFTCDGQTDRIAGWVDRDNPDGPFFDVLFVTRDGGTLSSELKQIPFAQDKQFALCVADDTAPPPMSWQQVEPDYVRDVVGNANLCTTAVRIEDFLCDTPQFYWNKKADKNGDHWVFYRN